MLQWLAAPNASDFDDLASLLVDAVENGASVNWVVPPSQAEAVGWWRAAAAETGTELLVHRDQAGRIVGCVRLMPARQPNGHHRAEVGKLLVHSEARGQGIATKLMAELEAHARSRGLTLLHLDTETGSYAQGFYQRRGWIEFGILPNHTVSPAGELSATTFFYKTL